MKLKTILITFLAAYCINNKAATIQEFMNIFPVLNTMPSNITQLEQLPKHELMTTDVAQYLQQTLNGTGQWDGLTVTFYGVGKVSFDGYCLILYEAVTPYLKRYYLCTINSINLTAYPQTLQIYCSVGGLVVTDFEIQGKDVIVRRKDFTQELIGEEENVYWIDESITQHNATDNEVMKLREIQEVYISNGKEIVVENENISTSEDTQISCAANRQQFFEAFPLLNQIPSDLEEAEALKRVKLYTPDALQYLQQTFNNIETWEGDYSLVTYNGIGRISFDDYDVILYEVMCPFQRKIYMCINNGQESQMYPQTLLVYDQLKDITFKVDGMNISIFYMLRSSAFPHIIKEVYSITKHFSLVEKKSDFIRGLPHKGTL